jgi:hypothetical protein
MLHDVCFKYAALGQFYNLVVLYVCICTCRNGGCGRECSALAAMAAVAAAKAASQRRMGDSMHMEAVKQLAKILNGLCWIWQEHPKVRKSSRSRAVAAA